MSAHTTGVVHRFEVLPKAGAGDPIGQSVLRDAKALGITPSAVRASHVYLIETSKPLTREQQQRVGSQLLADPVTESFVVGASARGAGEQLVEVHPLPGVMDPVAQSVQLALTELIGTHVQVATGWRYDLAGVNAEQAKTLAGKLLANPVIQRAVHEPYCPGHFPVGVSHGGEVRSVAMINLSDDQLTKLSREAHLFLSLDEMRAVQEYYRKLGREPREIELETLAQTWSEHCVHKTLKANVEYRAEGRRETADGKSKDIIDWSGRPGHVVRADGVVEIKNLLKSSVAAATFKLIEQGVDWTLSVFKDNSGVIALDDKWGVCIKVETHNRPSAIEPYGGAATGAGGCIRDVIGTGLGARPIASTDVFCVAEPQSFAAEADGASASVDLQITKWTSDAAPVQAEGTVNGHPFFYRARHGEWQFAISLTAQVQAADVDESQPGVSWCLRGVDSKASHQSREQAEGIIRQCAERSMRDRFGLQRALPPGTLHPRRILTQVVAGVRDYGNRMGIPTVTGGVYFDDRYVGNPLVFCGCIGLIPRHLVKGAARAGDRIVALGGRTGRDGIHGATFSSAQLEQNAADEFSHAVQIGNAITEKQVLDAILRARDEFGQPLYHGMTDCGAGGFSSAIGEMGSTLGAEVHLERAPLKYAGLSPTEIWISEAQERMVLAVPSENIEKLRAICKQEGVELAELGHFGTPNAELILNFHGREVGRISMHLLHEGIPMPTRQAAWSSGKSATSKPVAKPHVKDALLKLLAHPNIASKHWIIRQYDHEVQGASVVKPLVGPALRGPSDASVLEPIAGSGRGIALSQGLQTGIGDPALGGDPYLMTLAAIDECVRNLVCVGADPEHIAILDNFCWPSCGKPANMGALVRACAACYDGAMAYRTPFVSGKDSLNNQLSYTDPVTGEAKVIEIPPTLLITGMGIVPRVERCVTMDAKAAGHAIVVVGATQAKLGGSHVQRLFGVDAALAGMPVTDLKLGPATARAVAKLIARGVVLSSHDVSDGGVLCAIAEMLIGGSRKGSPIGAQVDLSSVHADATVACFGESPSRYVLELREADVAGVIAELQAAGISAVRVGTFDHSGVLTSPELKLSAVVGDLTSAWLGTLDW